MLKPYEVQSPGFCLSCRTDDIKLSEGSIGLWSTSSHRRSSSCHRWAAWTGRGRTLLRSLISGESGWLCYQNNL
ncbi:hypothetical protein SDJN03_06349, partial [Cucurbita argyrosperma subsp. sororia]